MRKYASRTGGYVLKEQKNKTHITLDADILEKVKELAKNDERSVSQYINRLLKDHITAGVD